MSTEVPTPQLAATWLEHDLPVGEARDALPGAFVDAGVDPMPSKSVALKVAYDAFASLDLSGSVNWQW